MGYDARISFEAEIREGVTHQMVQEAVRPLLEHCQTLLLSHEDSTFSRMISFESGLLVARIDTSVSYGFQDEVFIPVVNAVGLLAAEPFEACLEDQNTGDAEERY